MLYDAVPSITYRHMGVAAFNLSQQEAPYIRGVIARQDAVQSNPR